MYDVVVLADDREAEAVVKAILQQPVEGLPQGEPWFNVMTSGTSTLTDATKYARSIVAVNVEGNSTSIKYQRDVYATGQTIVYISSPSIHRLRYDSARIANALLPTLEQAEIDSERLRLAKTNNGDDSRKVKSAIGCDILVPKDMTAAMQGRNFIWLSNNANRAMQSLCIYTYPGATLNADRAIRMRNSVMGANIKGEERQMHMATETAIKPTVTIDHDRLTMRGLWIMEGDAMGGPFVSLSISDPSHDRIVVAEGFVYAPESKKKILIKQLEAAISTLKLQTK